MDLSGLLETASSLPWPMFLALALVVLGAFWYLQVFSPMSEDLTNAKALSDTTLKQMQESLKVIQEDIVTVKALQEFLRSEVVRLAVDVNDKLLQSSRLMESHTHVSEERHRISEATMDSLKDLVIANEMKLDNLKERMIIVSTTLSHRQNNGQGGNVL